MEVQDFVITDTWIDKKTGEEVSKIRKIGVSFKMKGGGWRHKLYLIFRSVRKLCRCR
jgi:hypothetical protein